MEVEQEQDQDKSRIIKYEEGSAELIPISDVSTKKYCNFFIIFEFAQIDNHNNFLMFLQDSFKKEENLSIYNSDSDDQILVKSPSPERKETDLVIDLVDSD